MAFDETDLYEIVQALEDEIDSTPEYISFEVKNRQQEGDVWSLTVNQEKKSRGGLDESLEGANAWWAGPPNGVADVLAVLPEDGKIYLRFVKSSSLLPPSPGQILRLYPPKYLDALLNCWSHGNWGTSFLTWGREAIEINESNSDSLLKTDNFPGLRKKQREAFSLPIWKASFLHGPPGTGKTFTLGALVAQYLLQYSQRRVLFLSTTNNAVDIALIKVDEQLELLSENLPEANAVRNRCFRVGNHYRASKYQNRKHLLPLKDDKIIQALIELEKNRPEKDDLAAYNEWKQAVETCRKSLPRQAKETISKARLAAMTVTNAVFMFELLKEQAPFDLLVFDEASQVSQAHALALSPFGKSVLYAGDPKQLGPIVISKHKLVNTWLGSSMFKHHRKDNSSIMLDEQSRMAEPICDLLSNVFYGGKLYVADDSKYSQEWIKEHTPEEVDVLGNNHIHIEHIQEEGHWVDKFHGPIRHKSVEAMIKIIKALLQKQSEKQILVITPFRAQRKLIRWMFRDAGLKQIRVTTVHRAQGDEEHTIIYDPVMGDSAFLKDEEGKRLINVALSRAKCRLVLLLSDGDIQNNEILMALYHVVNSIGTTCTSISELICSPDFPECALTKGISIETSGKITEGLVESISADRQFIFIRDFRTGKIIQYQIAGLRNIFGSPVEEPSKTAVVPKMQESDTKEEGWEKIGYGKNECYIRRTATGTEMLSPDNYAKLEKQKKP